MSNEPSNPEQAGPIVVPAPREAKPRILQDGRDMFWSMGPLVLACIVLAGLVGTCSFTPTGPTPGVVPSYDAAVALQSDAETLGFPIRLPDLPDGWQPNSGLRTGIDNARTDPATGQPTRALLSRVGYVSPSGLYVSLHQSNADEDALVRWIYADAYPTGTVDVDGQRWVVYSGSDAEGDVTEPVWTTRLGSADRATQIALTGAGRDDDFRTMAVAVQSAQPLPEQRP